jgi:hypothetical protein
VADDCATRSGLHIRGETLWVGLCRESRLFAKLVSFWLEVSKTKLTQVAYSNMPAALILVGSKSTVYELSVLGSFVSVVMYRGNSICRGYLSGDLLFDLTRRATEEQTNEVEAEVCAIDLRELI